MDDEIMDPPFESEESILNLWHRSMIPKLIHA